MYAAYNGESSKKKDIDHRLSYDHFYALRLIDSFLENRHYQIIFAFNCTHPSN